MKQTHTAIDSLCISQVENHFFQEHYGDTYQW